jgi:GNAT superfamily N-acetyltransferase
LDYAGLSVEELEKAAVRYFKGYFGTVRGAPLPASCWAEESDAILGAALIKKVARGPLLDCVFVAPRHQHGGIATALVGHAVNRLWADGERELYSLCMLGNEGSLEWHRQFGFQEVSSLIVANHRANHFRDELDRHRRLGDLPAQELTALTAEAEHWSAERARLQAIADHDFWAAHPRLEV